MDMGQFQPSPSLPPTRSRTGAVTLPRLTTTEEQRAEALERMGEFATENKSTEVEATIIWASGDPTILRATFVVEHMNGKRVWLPDTVVETTIGGAEIKHDEAARLRLLSSELVELHENGML